MNQPVVDFDRGVIPFRGSSLWRVDRFMNLGSKLGSPENHLELSKIPTYNSVLATQDYGL